LTFIKFNLEDEIKELIKINDLFINSYFCNEEDINFTKKIFNKEQCRIYLGKEFFLNTTKNYNLIEELNRIFYTESKDLILSCIENNDNNDLNSNQLKSYFEKVFNNFPEKKTFDMFTYKDNIYEKCYEKVKLNLNTFENKNIDLFSYSNKFAFGDNLFFNKEKTNDKNPNLINYDSNNLSNNFNASNDKINLKKDYKNLNLVNNNGLFDSNENELNNVNIYLSSDFSFKSKSISLEEIHESDIDK